MGIVASAVTGTDLAISVDMFNYSDILAILMSDSAALDIVDSALATLSEDYSAVSSARWTSFAAERGSL